MTKSIEIPDCSYPKEATLITPSSATPRQTLYLSNLDDQPFLRFRLIYVHLYEKSVCVESLKASLSRVLVNYYPLAGRLRPSGDDGAKLEVDCNGQGALFAEGFLPLTAGEFLEGSRWPNRSWKKLLFMAEAQEFLDVPPLVIQVTHLSCGGMILCTSISHCLCDSIGSAQFLHAWANLTAKPNADLSLAPFHDRRILKPRCPASLAFSHPEFNSSASDVVAQFLQSQPRVTISVTFYPSQILNLKKTCIPLFKCTSFEVLASHVWRCWIRAMDLPSTLNVKLIFTIDVRKKLSPELPMGYYGNGFVLGCAESSVDHLITSNAHYGIKLVQQAKERIDDGYVRSVIDLLEERRGRPDLSMTLVMSQWSKLGLEEVDFGEGRPVHMGPLENDTFCLLLPVIGDIRAFTVLVGVPEGMAERFEHLLRGSGEENEGRGYN